MRSDPAPHPDGVQTAGPMPRRPTPSLFRGSGVKPTCSPRDPKPRPVDRRRLGGILPGGPLFFFFSFLLTESSDITPSMAAEAPLHGIRVIECSTLGPGAITMPLADLGADVIKVEPPAGRLRPRDDLADRRGRVAPAPAHQPGQAQRRAGPAQRRGRGHLQALVRHADVVVEAMRPGGLARRGLGFERLREVNPRSCSAPSRATA